MCRINLWLIFSETFAAAAGGGETCLMCNQRDVFLPAGSRPSVRRHMMHVLHLPNLRSLLTFPPAFFSQDGIPLSGCVWGFDLQDFCADVQCAGCGGGGGGVSGVGKVHRRLLHSGVRLPACCRPDERTGKEWKMWIEH